MKLKHLVVLVGALASMPAMASHVDCINSNIDIYNRTGTTANDLEIHIGGVSAAQIGSNICGGFYNGSFPGDPTVTNDGDGVTLRWSGTDITSGNYVHVGYNIVGNPAFTSYSVTWTSNGTPIPNPPLIPMPDAGQYWNGRSIDNLVNTSGSNLWIQRRYVTLPGIVTIDQLLPGGAVDSVSITLDATPVSVASGSNLLYTLPSLGDVTQSYVMIYDVFADNSGAPGLLLATYLNDQVFIPEPASLALLGIAGLGFAASRRRKLPV